MANCGQPGEYSEAELFQHAYDLERLLASHFRRVGFEVVETGEGRDFGVDLIMRKDERVTYVSVKCSTKQVGAKSVKAIRFAMIRNGADAAWLATNSRFSWQAREAAREPGGRVEPGERSLRVHLLDGSDLQRAFNQTEMDELRRISNRAARMAPLIGMYGPRPKRQR